MKSRLNFFALAPEVIQKFTEIEIMIGKSSIDKHLLHLIKLRVSQINQCAFCVDMHVKQATIDGEKALRLHHLAVWVESPLFNDKEKAAFKWAEAVTRLSESDVSEEVYLSTREHYSEKEIVELNTAVVMINVWNRYAATFRQTPGVMDEAYGLKKAGL
jgi:AhpD family alkylhydroperoxidase